MTFDVGQSVRVSSRGHDGHHRTPGYLKGKTGRVERAHEAFTNPETRAYGSDGHPKVRLYLVAFDQADVWPGYAPVGDTLRADFFEHWLEPA